MKVWQLVTTLAQAALSWSALLYFIPLAIVQWQQGEELHHLGFDGQPLPGLALFALASAANLWSRLTLTWYGQGHTVLITPPAHLVVRGPYAWLRNPITATTIAQGMGVFLYTGSVLVLGYVGLLALLWHLVVRPPSEHELQRRFGRDYEFYRRSVRLWLPMRRPFQPRKSFAPIGTDQVQARTSHRKRRRR
jgi:protein-S-isoprenylcysteine O-methyltransferase Ste14